MSEQGTFDGVIVKEAKSGKAYGKVSISRNEYLSFGNTLGKVQAASEGDVVSFTWKPSDRGDGKILTEFKVVGSGGGTSSWTSGAPASVPVARATTPTSGRSNDPNIQLSIFYGYAKDLVANGVVKPPLANPTSVADTVSTVAREIMRKFQEDISGAPSAPLARQDIKVVENPS